MSWRPEYPIAKRIYTIGLCLTIGGGVMTSAVAIAEAASARPAVCVEQPTSKECVKAISQSNEGEIELFSQTGGILIVGVTFMLVGIRKGRNEFDREVDMLIGDNGGK